MNHVFDEWMNGILPFASSAPFISEGHAVKLAKEQFITDAIELARTQILKAEGSKNVARIKNAIDNNMPFLPLELGNIDAKRDWSHAEDFVKGIWKMLNQDEPKEHLLSSGETHTVREFVELAFEAAGIKGKWTGEGVEEVYIDNNRAILTKINPEFYRPAEVDLLWGDSRKARLELGWLPKVSFKELVNRMVENDILLVKNIN